MKNKFSIFNFQFSITQNGQFLVEILLIIGLSAIILPALLTGLVASREGKAQQTQRTQAVYLLNETVDAVRSVREKGWTSFAVGGVFHPIISGSNWTFVPGSRVSAGLRQKITVSDLSRDSNGTIVTTGGTLDPSSKKVDISISWRQPYLSTVSASLFITRYLGNNSFTQTSVADFNVGTKSGTTVTDTAGGEVTLEAGGQEEQYGSSGTFTSGPFDASSSAAFNRFDVSVNRPSTSDITFQVAVAPAVSGSCSGASFNFVGPNATSSAFFTTTVTSGIQSFNYPIPPIINPGRCFKYKAFLSTTDSLSTPIFYDITGNYSP